MMSFPQFIASFNSHMMVIENPDKSFSLIPPNQCDWMYTLKKITDTKWHLRGTKDDIYYDFEEIEKDYEYDAEEDTWN